ncbi:transporter, drug/metabolite exporter family [Luminiphilus syltensis NOR5-1B]|uniref:Transporter, drug/metabolite exporter family n=2 Tax=Luminiphilus TaxID=1341118 RepID=B8KSA4_9GAMM|nr:transporter, drug/metabolite exporter family [Luminiphilus syltensis NOR5-1B]
MILSALGFALMGALVKTAGDLGIPLMQIIFARALVSVLLSLFDIRRVSIHPLGTQRGLLLIRGLVGFASLSCVYYAVLTLSYAEATVLQYMHPLFTTVLALLLLGEYPTRRTLTCVVFSFAGLLVMALPGLSFGGVGGLPPWGVAAGLAGAAGSGLAYTIVRKLARSEHPSVIVLYFPMVCIPGSLILGWNAFVLPDTTGLLVLLGVGCFTQLGQVALTRAMQVETASRNTSLSYIQIVFAALLGFWFFGETPNYETMAGIVLILAGAGISLRAPPEAPA